MTKKTGKGDTSISEVMYTMMSLLFLLLGVVLLVSITMSTIDPYDQMAFANVEKLRASMDEACFTGSPVTVANFQLPQNTPKFTSLISVMPIWIIRTNGDPNFVLYYESFPAGDATGWEIYQGLENRLVTHLPLGYENRLPADVKTYSNSVRDLWHDRVENDDIELTSKRIEGVIVNNVVIGSRRTDFYYGPNSPYGGFAGGQSGGAGASGSWDASSGPVDVGPDSTLVALGKFGEWRDLQNPDSENPVASEGDNAFIFNNYKVLTSFEKSAIKYAPCGDNALCLKTRTGVYKYPLRQCGDIKYIELQYDDTNKYVTYGTAGVVVVTAVAGICLLTAGGCVPAAIGGSAAGGTALTPTAVAAMAETAGGSVAAEAGAAIISGGRIIGFVKKGGSALGFLGKGLWKIIGFVPGLRSFAKIIGISGATYGAYEIGEYMAGAFLSYKIQDFNIESDCSINQMKIEKVPCEELECSIAVSYPMYKYVGDGRLSVRDANGNIMEHFTCLEKIGTDIQDTSTIPSTGFNGGQCLRVTVEEKPDGFCWTPDPFKQFSFYDADTQVAARTLGFLPINENTAYISDDASRDAVVLKYYPQGDLESWKEFFERRLSWGWPG